jgi:hypothetical protein
MAQINLSIRRDNGVTISADAQVPDEYVRDLAMTLGAILFDASADAVQPTEPETPAEPTEP